MGLRYRRIKFVAYAGNNSRSLVLRCLYAQELLKQFELGKKIFVIDESWLNYSQYSRRKWRKRNQTNSHSERKITPRISLLAAIDTDGNQFACLSQSNTNHESFMAFV